MRSEPGRLQRGERGDGLHQRLAGAAGFRDRDEARGRERQALQQRAVSCRDRDCPGNAGAARCATRRRPGPRSPQAAPASGRRGSIRRCRGTRCRWCRRASGAACRGWSPRSSRRSGSRSSGKRRRRAARGSSRAPARCAPALPSVRRHRRRGSDALLARVVDRLLERHAGLSRTQQCTGAAFRESGHTSHSVTII